MIIIIVVGVVEAREGLGRNVEIMLNLDPNGGARVLTNSFRINQDIKSSN